VEFYIQFYGISCVKIIKNCGEAATLIFVST
jgi:hypothetical protein